MYLMNMSHIAREIQEGIEENRFRMLETYKTFWRKAYV